MKKTTIKQMLGTVLAVCCMATATLLPLKFSNALIASAAYSTGKYTLSSNSANVRENPGSDVIGYIANGATFTVTKISDNWGYATDIPGTSGKTLSGWICLDNCVQNGTTPNGNTTPGTSSVGEKVMITGTDEVNFRSGAGTSYDLIGKIPKGTVVTIAEKSNGWYRVTYDGKTGWFSSEYSTAYTEPSSGEQETTTTGEKVTISGTDEVNFRSGAGTSYDLIGAIPRGTVVTVLEKVNGWYRVTYDGKTGWFSSKYCTPYTESTPGTQGTVAAGEKVVVSGTKAVNFRTGAGTSHDIICTIPKGTVLTVAEVANGWYRVTYDGKTGWFSAEYSEKYTESTPGSSSTPGSQGAAAVGTKVQITGAVFFRTGADTSYDIIDTLPKGTVLTVIDAVTGWYSAEYEGHTGWFSSDYCTAYTGGEQTPPSTPASDKVKITAAVAVNLRSGAGTSYDLVGFLTKGTVVTVSEESNGWYKTTYKGKTGWFSSKYCTEYISSSNTLPPSEQGSVAVNETVVITAATSVNFRSGAGTSYAILKTIPHGAVVTVTEKLNGWYKTTYGGKTGWFSSDYCAPYNGEQNEPTVTPSNPTVGGKVVVTAEVAVNLRKSPDTSSQILAWIRNGTVLNYTESSNGWLKVSYNGKTGWIVAAYTKAATNSGSSTPSAGSSSTGGTVSSGNHTGVQLNFNASYNYAKKYWNQPDPNYTYSDGFNCCSYVSQILVAGGLSETEQFHDYTDPFIRIDDFVHYMSRHYGIDYIQNPTTTQVEPGDAVITDDGAHIMYTMDKDQRDGVYASGNTNNRDCMFLPISDIFAVVKTSEFFK